MALHPVHGHEAVRKALARARSRGTLPTALLFHGPRGTGKQRLALWLGQLVLCEEPSTGGPCGECHSCRLALHLRHPDLHWYFPLPRPKRASTPEKLAAALEEARADALVALRDNPILPSYRDDPAAYYLAQIQGLRRKAHSRPSMSPEQVFVVAEAESLVPQESSPEAANALLKVLEEPPRGTRLVLTSNEPGRLLPTILSRTVPVHVAAQEESTVREFLVERAGADPDIAARYAPLASGSIGVALGFVPDGDEPGPLDQVRQEAFQILRAALIPDPGSGFATALQYRVAGARGYVDHLALLEGWIRDLAAAASDAPERIVNVDARDWLVRQARDRGLHPAQVARSMEVVEEARWQARGNVNPQLFVTGLVAGLRARLFPDSVREVR